MPEEGLKLNSSLYFDIYFEIFHPFYVENRDQLKNFQEMTDTVHFLMPYVIGIPQILLNLLVLTSVIIIIKNPVMVLKNSSMNSENGETRNRGTYIRIDPRFHKAAFIFIANMAMADFLLAIVQFVIVESIESTNGIKESLFNVATFDTEKLRDTDVYIKDSCRMQIVLWLYSISVTMLSLLAITIDRFIYIMYGIKYLSIMTSRRLKIVILLNWTMPLVAVLMSFFSFQHDKGPECYFGHNEKPAVILLYFAFLIFLLLLFYIIYINIIVKSLMAQRKRLRFHHSKKQKMRTFVREAVSRKCSQNITKLEEEADAQRFRSRIFSISYTRGPSQIAKRGRAAIYIILLLLALTFSWTILITIMGYDIKVHFYDHFENELAEMNCGKDSTSKNDTFPKLSFQVCLNEAIINPEDNECNITQLLATLDMTVEDEYICYLAIETIHGNVVNAWEKLSLTIGMINSVLNPIIYAFWYRQFRLRIVKAWKSFFEKCRRRRNQVSF